MEKKKVKPSDSSALFVMPVQFRPNAELGRRIGQFAKKWKTSRNDAARRLCCLAAFGFGERHHDLVETYSGRQIGGEDFVHATVHLFLELQAVDTTRCSLGKSAMTADEKEVEIVKIARDYCVVDRNPEVPEEEKPRVYVYEQY